MIEAFRFFFIKGGTMYKTIALLLGVSGLCVLSYQYGKSQAKVETIEKQVEVVRYEVKEVCKIMAKPNLNDDDISQLFATGKL